MTVPNPALAAIQDAVRAIPRGRVSSYGAVAARAGWPGRARLVARALSEATSELPWHRVLRADGRIAFPEGSAGFREQAKRLRAEGVRVQRGRVDLAEYATSVAASLDESLWAMPGVSR